MANPTAILQQLNDKLFTKHFAKNPEVEVEDPVEESQASKKFIGHYVRRGQGEYKKGDDDEVIDVDNLQAGDVDDEYKTHHPVSFEQFINQLKEQMVAGGGSDTLQQGQSPADVGAAAAGGDPTGGAVDTPEEMQAAPDAGGMPPEAMEPGMGQPLPEEDTSKTPSDLGRIYELKKIYVRLTVIEAFLTESSDSELIEARTIVSKAIELFEILASNLSSYKPPRAPEETLDEIIVQYYMFLEKVYESVAKYYKSAAKEQDIKRDLPPDKPKIRITIPGGI
jgi:hypothetical protein